MEELQSVINRLADAVAALASRSERPGITYIGSQHQVKQTALLSIAPGAVDLCDANPRRWCLILTAYAGGPNFAFPNTDVVPVVKLTDPSFVTLDFATYGALVGLAWRATAPAAGMTINVTEVILKQ